MTSYHPTAHNAAAAAAVAAGVAPCHTAAAAAAVRAATHHSWQNRSWRGLRLTVSMAPLQ
jgi:hypothetical protein